MVACLPEKAHGDASARVACATRPRGRHQPVVGTVAAARIPRVPRRVSAGKLGSAGAPKSAAARSPHRGVAGAAVARPRRARRAAVLLEQGDVHRLAALAARFRPRTARRSWHRSQRTAPPSPRALRTSPTSSSSPASSSGKKLGGSPPKRELLAPPPSPAAPSSVAAAIGLGKVKGCPSRPSNRRAASGSRFSHTGECARGWSRVESVVLGVRTRMRPGVTAVCARACGQA